jgi:drug/metabolite transporter (DMT)-like permease
MRRYSPYKISAVVGLAALIPLAATAAPQLASQDWDAITVLAWGAVMYSMLFSFVITNVLWFTAIDRVGANRASLYANLQPFLGAFFALVVLSEEMSLLQFIGGAIIGAGILVAREARPPAPSPD